MQFPAKQGSCASCGCEQSGSETVLIEGRGAVRDGDTAGGVIQASMGSVTVEGRLIVPVFNPVTPHGNKLCDGSTTCNPAATVLIGRGAPRAPQCSNPAGKGGCLDDQEIQQRGAVRTNDGIHRQQTEPLNENEVERWKQAAKATKSVVITVRNVDPSGARGGWYRLFMAHGRGDISTSSGKSLFQEVIQAFRDNRETINVRSVSVFSMCFQAQNYDSINMALTQLRSDKWKANFGDVIPDYLLQIQGAGYGPVSEATLNIVRAKIERDMIWVRDHIPFPDTVGQSAAGPYVYQAGKWTNPAHVTPLPVPRVPRVPNGYLWQ